MCRSLQVSAAPQLQETQAGDAAATHRQSQLMPSQLLSLLSQQLPQLPQQPVPLLLLQLLLLLQWLLRELQQLLQLLLWMLASLVLGMCSKVKPVWLAMRPAATQELKQWWASLSGMHHQKRETWCLWCSKSSSLDQGLAWPWNAEKHQP